MIIVFVGEDLKPTPAVAKQLGAKAVDLIAKAAAAENFKGKAKSAMSIVVPTGLSVDRLIVVGIGGERTGRPGFRPARRPGRRQAER